MPRRDQTPRDLLFGLLALQIGLIDQDQLVTAFAAWSRTRGKTLAEILVERGAIDEESRALLAGMAEKQLKLHGGDLEKSLAAVALGSSTREKLAALEDADLAQSLPLVGSKADVDDPYRTVSPAPDTTVFERQRFQILRPHARGGLGAVYVALDGELNREVALKEILDKHADDPNPSGPSFVLEAEITGNLEHPGIVPVYGLGQSRRRPAVLRDEVHQEGTTSKQAIERVSRRPESLKSRPGPENARSRCGTCFRRFTDVCNAIDYAHGRGVLHRDLKPGNVIVGKYGETLVVDWGLAKAMGQSETTSRSDEPTLKLSSTSGSAQTMRGSAIGTPAFMSPEQAIGDLENLGTRSDVYSLGATLYCLLTGKAPFDGETLDEVLHKVQKGHFPTPRQLDPSIDKALEAVCLKAMALKPENRHASARALADDIERWAADEPTSAWVEPFSVRARRWMRLNRTIVTAASVALLVALAGTAAVLAVQTRANVKLASAYNALTTANGETRAALTRTKQAQVETTLALARSEESRGQAEAVGNLLLGTFRKPDTEVNGKDVKVAEILDQAIAELAQGFSGSKATEGAFLNALGKSYHSLGLYSEAEATFKKALIVHETALGSEHPDTLLSRNNFAQAYQDAGRVAEAIPIFETTLKQSESRLGPEHSVTLTTRNNLAGAYLVTGRFADAIPIYEATLKKRELKLGPEHPDTLLSRNNLAQAYQAAGRLADAIPIIESTLKQKVLKFGPEHSDTLVSRNNLALAYLDAGRIADAIPILETTRKQTELKRGPEHPDTLRSRNNLARAYQAAGRIADAIPIYEATLKLSESKLGPDHPHTLISRNNLANAYHNGNRIAEAIPIYEATLKLSESKLGFEHPYTLLLRNNLASAYKDVGRLAEAIPIFELTLKQRESKLGPEHPDTLSSRNNLANAYQNAGRLAQAIPIFETTLKQRESKFGADHPDTTVTRNNLGTAYYASGRLAEAIPIFETTLKHSESKLGPEHPDTLNSRINLAVAYRSTGRLTEAIPLFEATLKSMESRLGPENSDALLIRSIVAADDEVLNRLTEAESMYREILIRRRKKEKPDSLVLAGELTNLGRNLLKQAKWSEAEPLLRECLAIRVQAIPDDYRRFNTESLLGGALLSQGKFAEAEPLILAGYEGMKAREAKIPPAGRSYLTEAGQRVVQLYRAWGQPQKAAERAARFGLAELPTDVFAK